MHIFSENRYAVFEMRSHLAFCSTRIFIVICDWSVGRSKYGYIRNSNRNISMTLKALVSAATVALLSLVLSGCVSDSYYYDGYRDYGPAYGRYESSAVIYRTGPRYRSQHYRSGRYYRDDRPRRDRREARSSNRSREAERNTRERDRDRKSVV